MNALTFGGIFLGIILISTAIIREGSAVIFLNLNAAFITIGGTVSATFIAYPFKDVRRLLHVALNAFKKDIYPPGAFIETILYLSKIYRSGGLKKLETEEESLYNRYLRLGVELIVDGYDERDIHTIMEKERLFLSLRHESGEMILRTMARFAPAFGMAGTLIGLIHMLLMFDNPAGIGRPLAQALVSTFYGILAANLVLLPLAAKLKTRTDSEIVLMRVIMDGILGIYRKENPAKLKRHLNSILPPSQRIE
ncbi:MAG: MotA/TolQ/ExbB proton channel family protein [Deltaproteobacteria bacterium]|nr:MotA/TolQ/ExbB proton channel family protein [Deltaproteobacteria bacterium]